MWKRGESSRQTSRTKRVGSGRQHPARKSGNRKGELDGYGAAMDRVGAWPVDSEDDDDDMESITTAPPTLLDTAYDELRKDAMECFEKSVQEGSSARDQPTHASDHESSGEEDHESQDMLWVADGAGDPRMVDARPPHVQIVASEREYTALLASRDYRRAVHVLVSRLALLRLVYGLDHITVAQGHITLGRAYFELLNYPKQALDHAQRAKAMHGRLKQDRTKLRLHRHQLVELAAATCCLMGQALAELQRLDEAEKALRRGLQLLNSVREWRAKQSDRSRRSRGHSPAGRPGSPRGRILSKQQPPQSLSPSSQPKGSRPASEGPEASRDAAWLNSIQQEEVRARVYLCRVLHAQNKVEGARNEITTLQTALSEQNTSTADPNLAIVAYCTAGSVMSNVDEKLAALQRASALAEEQQDDVDSMVQCWTRLAEAHSQAGQLPEAETIYTKALDALNSDLDNHPNTILAIQESRARVLVRLGRRSSAVEMLAVLKEKVEDKFGRLSMRTANINHFLGSLFLSTGDMDNALAHFQERMEALVHIKGANHSLTQETRSLVESLRAT